PRERGGVVWGARPARQAAFDSSASRVGHSSRGMVPSAYSCENISHATRKKAAITGPITNPEIPNTASPPRRQEDKIVRHLGVAPDEERGEPLFHQAHHQNPGSDHDNALHDLTHPEEDHRRGEPDQARAHRGEHGEYSHERSPDYRGRNSESQEEDGADSTLHDANDEGALDRRQRDLGELDEERAFAHVSKRQRANQGGNKLAAVAKEEEEDVQHQEEQRGDPQHVLADAQRPGSDELRDRDRRGREPLPHLA